MTSKTHRISTCHRHPTKPLTGFCASCLTERLSGIESSSSSTAAAESLPRPEIRRAKSYSWSSADVPSSSTAPVPEPRRRSCEVRAARSTLWDLFTIDDQKKGPNRKPKVDSENSGFKIGEEEEEQEQEHGNDGGDVIRVCDDGFVCDENDEEAKTMKELIDLELRRRKNGGIDFRDIAGSFCKRLIKWKRKQKLKKSDGGNGDGVGGSGDGNGIGNSGVGLMSVEVEKQGERKLRETQSEVGEYGLLGRRSCDTDPRLSIDAGRMSLDDYGYVSRFSFDAPRASWDGYLIGRGCSRPSPVVHANGVDDNRVLVEEEEGEEMSLESGGEHCPGGSIQTKDYYSDSLSSQRRRRSFDRSSSRRKSSMADVDELRVMSNAKVSPAGSELFYGAKVLISEKDLVDTNLKSQSSSNVLSDCVVGSASNDASDVVSGLDQKGLKKLHKWGKLWNKLGLVHRRREDKLVEEEFAAEDTVNKPIAESWLRRAVNGHASGSVSQKLIRSYSVSCRNPCRMDGLVNDFGGPETNVSVNGRQELMLQRNRSVRHSPNNVDTGLLRFYLTPLKSYRRSRSGKSSLKDLNATSRTVL